jgi:type VI secretion system protein ImpL
MGMTHKSKVLGTATSGRTRVAFNFDGRKEVLDIVGAGGIAILLTSNVLKTFHCPSSMSTFSLTDSGPPPGLPPAGGLSSVSH